MWIKNFLSRNLTAVLIGGMAILILVVAPTLIPSFRNYLGYFWLAASFLAFIAVMVISRSYLRMKVRLFAERELHARQALRSELLLELRSVQCKLEAQYELLSTNQVFNIGDYQLFNRRLKKEHKDVLINDWSKKLELQTTPRSLAYLAHRICFLESRSKGRLATSIENAVLRVLVAAAVKDNNLRVLEIGTLFGIGLTSIYEYCKPRFSSVRLTAIDPLDGYYEAGVRDVLTDEPINEQTFRSNLAIAGVPEIDCKLIKALSTEALSIESAMSPLNDLLIIDGDHSYEGVKADLINYLPSVKSGGYVIFDDYGAPEWPGVQKFVDEEVFSNPNLVFIGESWRTAVFQVTK